MKYNQIMITSSNYEDINFLNVLEEMYNINPQIKFNTFDVVKYTKPTDDKLEENEFTFRLMTRQYNGPHDLDMLISELETRMQEQEMNQCGWSMERFVTRTMYTHRFSPSGCYTTELPFSSRYVLNIHYTDNKCLVWCLIVYLHHASCDPNRVSRYNKPEYIIEIKLPKLPHSYVMLPYPDAISKTLSDKECVTLNKFGLKRRKGIFPYEWFDSVDKLYESTLPPKEAFYSKLKQSGITDKEYKKQ